MNEFCEYELKLEEENKGGSGQCLRRLWGLRRLWWRRCLVRSGSQGCGGWAGCEKKIGRKGTSAGKGGGWKKGRRIGDYWEGGRGR